MVSPELNKGQNEKGGTTFRASTKSRVGIPFPDETVPDTRAEPEIKRTPPTKKKGLSTAQKVGLGGLSIVTLGGAGYAAYENVPAVHRAVDSAFLDHIKGNSEASINPEVFDPAATKGIMSEKNTILMTWEEYQKIAPPVIINRENVEKVPAEIKLESGGVRKLTFERGTSINTMIYVKTADGHIASVTYTKVTQPGEISGKSTLGFLSPGCQYLVGEKNEIQAGDIFPSPISGYAEYSGSKAEYYKGEKLEEGSSRDSSYTIESEYVDAEGKKVKVRAYITTLSYSASGITTPLVPNIPNSNSSDFEGKDPNTGGTFIDREKLNKARVKVNQGDDLFKFITVPPLQEFGLGSGRKSQVAIYVKYETDFGENGIANTFGGENCTHPTLDNKAIVLK